MLLGVAIATIALVAACLISIVFRPDPEVLRPIDGEGPEESGEGQADVHGARRDRSDSSANEE
jgi:hypothetical protein